MIQPKLLTYNGKTQSAKEWARELGVSRGTLRARIKKGYPPEKVFSPLHVTRGGPGMETLIKNKRPEGCCLPECTECPLEDCRYGGIPTPEETRKLKNAWIPLPDTGSGFDHVYISSRKIGMGR